MEEDLTPYQYEVACNLQDSLVCTVVSLIQTQDLDMLDHYYNFLNETVDVESITGIIADAYVWLLDNDKEAAIFFEPLANKLITQEDIKAAVEAYQYDTQEIEEEPIVDIKLCPLDIAHILLDEGYKPIIDYKVLKRTIKIFNPAAIRTLTQYIDMDSMSHLLKVCT